jgi:hypothetical protein
MGRKISAMCAVAGLAVLGTVAGAPPASAATSISFCFVQRNNVSWGGMPTYVQVFTASGWADVGTGTADSAGCSTFTLSGDYAVLTARGRAYYESRDFNGNTGLKWDGYTIEATPGVGHVPLGTSPVYCYPVTVACPVGSQ